MFTGLVEACAHVASLVCERVNGEWSGKGSARLSLKIPESWEPELGDSIAVNGVCLTLAELSSSFLASFDLSEETLARSNLKRLKAGDRINLERAMLPTTRLGGHLVSGHVDSIGLIESVAERGQDREISLRIPGAYAGLVIEKGSIAVDGVSLTVNSLTKAKPKQLDGGDEDWSVGLWIIPTTLANTTVRDWLPGHPANLEFDMIGKYLLRQLELGRGT